MPDQRRLRRLALTSAAVSAGAFALMLGGAAPADAAPAKCPVGHDAPSTIKSIQCNLEQVGKAIQKQIDKLTHPQQPQAQHPTGVTGGTPSKQDGTTTGSNQQSTGGGNTTVVPPGTVIPDSNLQPQVAAPGVTEQVPQFPILATDQPQIAAQQPQLASTAPVPETHLISPAAATAAEQQSPASPLIIAGASGAAGAVVALNISYGARRLRRRPTRP